VGQERRVARVVRLDLVAVDIDLAEDRRPVEHRDDDLGPGFEEAREILRRGSDVVDDDGPFLAGRAAAHSEPDGDLDVLGRPVAVPPGEAEHLPVERVDADPPVVRELHPEEPAHLLERVLPRQPTENRVDLEERRGGLAGRDAHDRTRVSRRTPRGRNSAAPVRPAAAFELPRRIPPRAFQTRAVPD
jgi:hypothetical protein